MRDLRATRALSSLRETLRLLRCTALLKHRPRTQRKFTLTVPTTTPRAIEIATTSAVPGSVYDRYSTTEVLDMLGEEEPMCEDSGDDLDLERDSGDEGR